MRSAMVPGWRACTLGAFVLWRDRGKRVAIDRRGIPGLPERPRAAAIGAGLRRSYPVGRGEFSRGSVGSVFEVSFTTDRALPAGVRAVLDTTMNAPAGEWLSAPIERVDERTFRCRITPERTGFFAFRARASLDGGATWVRDAVPLAWVMVDPPQVDGLRMYTMIPRVSGTIAEWAGDLERIQAMGFDTVHLLPVTARDVSESPYAARDLFEVDHAYLMEGARGDGLRELEGFVERARGLGVRLCFDLVLNHVGVRSTMARRAPGWIVPDEASADGNKRARYWDGSGWGVWDDLVLINYEHPSETTRAEIWHYMTEYALFWAHYADLTGGFVRLDNLHGSNREFVTAVARTLSAEYPRLGVLAEYFTDDATLLATVPECGLNLVLATPWTYKYVPELRAYLRSLHHLSGQVRYFMPINSHDSGSPAQEFGTAESTVPRYVAAALLGTGATGITQGVEWGIAERIGFIGGVERIPRPEPARFGAFIRRVNEILGAHPALRRGGNCEFVDSDHHAVIAALRRDGAEGFLVACNLDIGGAHAVVCDLSRWFGRGASLEGEELLEGARGRFSAERVELALGPCGAAVWRLRAES